MTQDLSNYTAAYYQRDIAETWFGRHGLLRPDQLAALCYTLGQPFWGHDRPQPRNPGLVLSVGCGRGELEKELERLGVEVVGYDPSRGARELYEGRHLVDELDLGTLQQARTVIFCESIEHIPAAQTRYIRQHLQPPATRLIITNWPDYHPIRPSGDGWDHITPVDDDLFDELARGARVVVRRGSHLVLDVGA